MTKRFAANRLVPKLNYDQTVDRIANRLRKDRCATFGLYRRSRSDVWSVGSAYEWETLRLRSVIGNPLEKAWGTLPAALTYEVLTVVLDDIFKQGGFRVAVSARQADGVTLDRTPIEALIVSFALREMPE